MIQIANHFNNKLQKLQISANKSYTEKKYFSQRSVVFFLNHRIPPTEKLLVLEFPIETF